jgi:hypothetical protein
MTSYQNFQNDYSVYVEFSFSDDFYKFYLQSIAIPDFEIGTVRTDWNGRIQNIIGDRITVDDLQLEFIIDDEMKVYKTLQAFIENYIATQTTSDEIYVYVQNNQNQTTLKFIFKYAFFYALSVPKFSTTTNGTELIATVKCAYNDYDVIVVRG